ncbi:MAG: DUF2142 domain-containing protein [Acidimicrobiales bacterium]
MARWARLFSLSAGLYWPAVLFLGAAPIRASTTRLTGSGGKGRSFAEDAGAERQRPGYAEQKADRKFFSMNSGGVGQTASRRLPGDKHRSANGFARTWIVAFLGLIVLGGAWVLATPLAAPPDEPTQVSHAYAALHGQLVGTKVSKQPEAVTAVRVPTDLAELQVDAKCANGPVVTPVTCLQHLGESPKITEELIYSGRYPPIYYLIVGLPTLISRGTNVVYAMRIVSVALSAAFLALSFACLTQRRRPGFALLGLTVAVTPMVLYLAASVNPSGLEISTAVALWSSLLALLYDRPFDEHRRGDERVRKMLIATAGVSTIVVTLVRGISPLWPVLVAGCLAPLVSLQKLRELWSRRDVRLWILGIIASYLVAGLWLILENPLATLYSTPLPANAKGIELVFLVAQQTSGWLYQYVGIFGSLTTMAPAPTYFVELVAVGSLVVVAALRGSVRAFISLAVTVVAAVVIPIILELAAVHKMGFGAQGRYFLPLAAGVPLVAGAIASSGSSEDRGQRRTIVSLVLSVLVAQALAFYGTLRRYMFGTHGPHDPFSQPARFWHPPLAGPGLDLIFVLGISWMGFWVIRWSQGAGSPRHTEASSLSAQPALCARQPATPHRTDGPNC